MPLPLLSATPLLLALQIAQGGLQGTVTDEDSGMPLAGVMVSLTDLDRGVVTDEAGRYRLSNVPAGPQHLSVRRIGYAPRTLHALVPGDGALVINVALRRLPVLLREVQVRPGITLRGVEEDGEAPVGARTISIAAARNHPLLAEPDAFLALAGGEVVVQPESPSGMHIAGGSSDQTAYVLDGVPIFSPFHAAGSFSAWNPDALHRLTVSAVPTPAGPDALAGTVTGLTRTPGRELRVQGSASSTQLRLTADGPLGGTGAGYLVSVRSGFPGMFAPPEESSYLRGETADRLIVARVPAGHSHVELLAYDADNEFGASAVAEGAETGVAPPRQRFQWNSRSLGMRMERLLGPPGRPDRTVLQLQAWRAGADASARWTTADGARLDLTNRRLDVGFGGRLTLAAAGTTTIGAWVRRSTTEYHVAHAAGGTPAVSSGGRQPLASAYAFHEQSVARNLTAALGMSASMGAGRLRIAPQLQLRSEPRADLSLTGAWARSFQFAQSARNPESVAGAIFPVDLYLSAGRSGVPVAESDLGLLAAAYRPRPGLRLGLQAYLRASRHLLLVAPVTGEPFADGAWSIGSSRAGGIVMDGAWSSARYGVLLSYAWQRVRFRYGDRAFVPAFGASQTVDAGVVFFPTSTWSIRLGGTVAAGRRGAALAGPFEWEACNLLDRGCEFGGTPSYDPAGLGRTALPSYARFDVGVRKHWHLSVAARDVLLEAFGTVTNVLGRANVLTFAVDPATGQPAVLEMRPRAPLVVGLDWRF